MNKCLLVCLAVLLSGFAVAQEARNGHGQPEPPVLGIHWARGVHPPHNAASSPNMTWHGGAVMPTTATVAIYWGTNWSNASFVDDKISGLDSWYAGVGNSTYAATCNEFSGSNGQVTSTISYGGHYTDYSAAPRRAPKTSAILGEVCKVMGNQVTSNGYYAVYVDTPRGHAGYCAWHSYGTCNGTPVQFAFFFNLDGDPGCDPQDTVTGHSQGLAALANVSGHELSEARTDPRGAGWYDNSGAENADKCAWTFGSPDLTFKNGSVWKIQGNWSNNAYNNKTGYPDSSGQKGCIDGGNY